MNVFEETIVSLLDPRPYIHTVCIAIND